MDTLPQTLKPLGGQVVLTFPVSSVTQLQQTVSNGVMSGENECALGKFPREKRRQKNCVQLCCLQLSISGTQKLLITNKEARAFHAYAVSVKKKTV